MSAANPLWQNNSATWARPVGMSKFVLMSFFTMGLYDVYWFYWNWRRQRDLQDSSLHPGWRTFVSPVTAYLLFRDVRSDPRSHGSWNSAVLAVAYFVMVMAFVAPGWLWVLTWLSFLPLVPVQQSINKIHAEAHTGEPVDDTLTVLNIFGILTGATLMALLVFIGIMYDRGTFDGLL